MLTILGVVYGFKFKIIASESPPDHKLCKLPSGYYPQLLRISVYADILRQRCVAYFDTMPTA